MTCYLNNPGFKLISSFFVRLAKFFLLENLIKHHREPLFCIKFHIHTYISSKQNTFWTGASHKYFCHFNSNINIASVILQRE